MPRPAATKTKVPGVSYRAEAPVYELFISIRATHTGTTVQLSYHEFAFGDQPLQGHMWQVKETSTRVAKGIVHLSNLAGWACRQAAAGRWVKKR